MVTPYLGQMTLIDLSSVLNRDTSFTGRSVVWAELTPYALEKPIIGYGWGGFWTEAKQEALHFPAHNGYLETMLNLGIIGTILFIVFIIINCRKSLQCINSNYAYGLLWFNLLLFTVARNITESINAFTDSLPALLVFMSVSFPSGDNITN
jgi:O-antigen ligase